MWSAKQRGIGVSSSADRCAAAQGLLCDTTQNPSRRPWSFNLQRLCRSSRPYSYQWDRRMLACEAFRAYGWESVTLDGLSEPQCWDLLGDSMALPTLAVAMISLLDAMVPFLRMPSESEGGLRDMCDKSDAPALTSSTVYGAGDASALT